MTGAASGVPGGGVPADAGDVPADAGDVLLPLARRAIEAAVGRDARGADADPTAPDATASGGEPAWLAEPGATFVTLTKHGQLRGCIGSLEAWRPLGRDVVENARSAAFRDPRFPAVTASELDDLHIEVSVLSRPEPLMFTDEADAVAQLRPGVDGVVLSAAGRRGTFLPQVWQQLPEPREFWTHLKRKAGLPASYWGDDVRIERYTVTEWHEQR